jgi:adenylate cyclase
MATERSLIILFGILFGYGLARFTPWSATGAALAGAIIVTFLSYQLFRQRLVWFPWMIIVAVQIPLAFAWSVVFNSVKLYVQNRLLQQTLSLHLSPKRVKQLLRSRSDIQRLLRPGAEKQLLTVIFTDIENFTAFAEGMDSDDLAKVMNNYFQTATDRCIHGTDGTVVKYIGDAIFAFWNAPDLQPDHQERACQAALLLRDQVLTFSKKEATWTMRTRIGLHTGVANVGNFGSATRIDYTAIGETINLASRMEGLNKYLGTHVLITEDTQVGIAQRLVTRYLGKFQMKGFERTVGVYELMGLLARAEATQTLREAFARALEQFQKGHFDAAKAGFDHVLEIQQNDGPTKFYLAKIAEFKDQPPPEDWAGEVELKEK